MVRVCTSGTEDSVILRLATDGDRNHNNLALVYNNRRARQAAAEIRNVKEAGKIEGS